MEQHLPKPGRPSPIGSWQMLTAVSEGLVVLSLPNRAARLYPLGAEGLKATGAVVRFFHDRLTEANAGMAAAAGELWTESEEHFQVAIRQADELPHRLEQPQVRSWYAQMLIDRDGEGDREMARHLLTEALSMYARIGMPRHEARAKELLSQLYARSRPQDEASSGQTT